MQHREERIGDVDVQQPKSQGRVSIRPTVLIGLGGTGKEVLRRLRRMFYEKYRRPGLPVMEYLWFDTDIRNIDITGKKTDRLDEQIDFSAQEKIDGSVSPAELESYRSNRGSVPPYLVVVSRCPRHYFLNGYYARGWADATLWPIGFFSPLRQTSRSNTEKGRARNECGCQGADAEGRTIF